MKIGRHAKPPGCFACPQEHAGAGYVPGEGPLGAPITILMEAPGYDEVAIGRPAVGAAGGMLSRVLHRTFRTREQFRIENVLRCCPPGYEIKKDWAEQAAAHCRRHSAEALDASPVILAMGGTAIRQALGLWDWEIKKLVETFHGTVTALPTGQYVVCTYHPSYLQRGAANLIGTVAYDLSVAQDVADGRWVPEPITPIMDPPVDWFREYVQQYKQAVRNDRYIALATDVETPDKEKGKAEDELDETDQSFQVDRINFAYHDDEGVTVPWVGPYIPLALELIAACELHYVWNGDYDTRRLLRLGAQFRGEIWDGMWLWHHYMSDVPKGLGFVNPFCSNGGAWATHRTTAYKHLFRSAPIVYAAYDGPTERRCINRTVEALQARGQWEMAHRHTVRLMNEVLKPAQHIGIQVDRPALDAFEADLAEKTQTRLALLQELVPQDERPLTGGANNQGFKKRPEGPHPNATTLKADGTVKKSAEDWDPLKVELYQQHARLVELQVPRQVYVCGGCGAEEVVAKHRCADKTCTPAVALQTRQVLRYFWLEPFNPDSPPQVLGYITARRHKPGRNKKTKNDSADRETLTRLRATTKDPVYHTLLEYRGIAKIRGTYAIGVRKRLDAQNRFHPVPTLKPSTLRTSYVAPNIQNVVADKDSTKTLAAGFRRCIVASPGCVLLEFDFSGIEAVQLAWFARDPLLMRLARLGIHAYLASHLLKRPADLSWSDADLLAYFKEIKTSEPFVYDQAKRNVHGNGYGMTPQGMWMMFPHLYKSLAAAKRVQDVYFEVAPAVPRLQNAIRMRAYDQGYIGGPTDYRAASILDDPNAHPYGYRHDFFDVVTLQPISDNQVKHLEAERVPVIELNGRKYAAKWGPDSKRCVTPDTKVWMGDYTYKPIGEVKVGDSVIGWRRGTEPKLPSRGNAGTQYMLKEKAYTADHLTRALVTEVHNLIDTTYTITLASGRTVRCTGDHKWLGMRRSNKGGPRYVWWRTDVLKVGDELAVSDVTDPGDCPEEHRITAAWLGGFYDGEGSHRGVAQANTTHGDLLQHAEQAFAALGFETTRQAIHPELSTRKPATQLNWTGGRQAALRFVRHVPSYRFRAQWADRMILGGRFRRLDPIVKIEQNLRAEPVTCITTTTGNFIANGLCSHNCLAFYPQSTAAGNLKEACLYLFAEPDHPSYIGDAYYGKTPLRAPIHDSLLLEVPERQVERVTECVYREMLRPVEEQPLPADWGYGPYLTIGVEAKYGRNWEDVEKLPGVTPADVGLDVLNYVPVDSLAADRTYFPATEEEEEDVEDLGMVVP